MFKGEKNEDKKIRNMACEIRIQFKKNPQGLAVEKWEAFTFFKRTQCFEIPSQT